MITETFKHRTKAAAWRLGFDIEFDAMPGCYAACLLGNNYTVVRKIVVGTLCKPCDVLHEMAHAVAVATQSAVDGPDWRRAQKQAGIVFNAVYAEEIAAWVIARRIAELNGFEFDAAWAHIALGTYHAKREPFPPSAELKKTLKRSIQKRIVVLHQVFNLSEVN